MKIFEIQMLGPQDLSPMMDTPVGYIVVHNMCCFIPCQSGRKERFQWQQPLALQVLFARGYLSRPDPPNLWRKGRESGNKIQELAKPSAGEIVVRCLPIELAELSGK